LGATATWRRDILLEAAHASEAFAVPKWRAVADEDGHYAFAVAL